MNQVKRTKYILHVSDFHLSAHNLEFAEKGLNALSDMLDRNDIAINYLIHTGDVIDSRGAFCIAAKDLYKKDDALSWLAEYVSDEDFNTDGFLKDPNATDEIIRQINEQIVHNMGMLYLQGKNTVEKFLADIRVRKSHTYFCIGNHDTLRPINKASPPECARFQHDYGDAEEYHKYLEKYEKENRIFVPYRESFLRQLGVWNPDLSEFFVQTGDINLIILNTNHPNPHKSKEGYYCIDCATVTNVLNKLSRKDDDKRLNIVIAHKPIYEICEAARMAFNSYHKTEFMTAIHNFLGENGVYICGDKHTRSVSDTTFHSIQHIIGGAPFKKSDENKTFDLEYNLIEVIGGKVGNIQKIHLSCDSNDNWKCVFRPEDSIVEKLYELSSSSLIPQCLSVLMHDSSKNAWTDISRIFYKAKGNNPKWEWLEPKLDRLYHIICKYVKVTFEEKDEKNALYDWDTRGNDRSIFYNMRDYLSEKMCYDTMFSQANILNIRGEYSSGKSTFLGILYIYLLYQYSVGNIGFIPAYFNLENKGILGQINSNNDKISYYKAAKESFEKFVNEVQNIAEKSHQAVCYLIDGLDEQDVWSYGSEDSIGRGILDVLASARNSKNIMSYSQHHLPLFKNTMPERKYKDYSDVMYFNNVHIVSADRKKDNFNQFISAFYSLKEAQIAPGQRKTSLETDQPEPEKIDRICGLIRKFCRLSVSQNFLYKFSEYIEERTNTSQEVETLSIDEVYRNYIDLLHKMCIDILGYGYVHYAPAMAYLFSFKGYTYERFKRIPPNTEDYWQRRITEYSDKVYDAFLFIKKNQDVREYLIAMHYNRELRLYAENPEDPIPEASILNEFIPRNIAIISRKMWKSDPNKFVIVCRELLERRSDLGQKPICNCALSMLIYTLAHQAKMYEPSNKMLDRIISSYETDTGKISDSPAGGFKYNTKNSDLLQQFLNFSLYRTYGLYKAVSEGDSEKLAISLGANEDFARYNRQYIRLYYGDLTISGENRKAALVPGEDNCLRGFDFHNTFNLISEKLRNAERRPYALMQFDLYSLCDLIQSRLTAGEYTDNQRYSDVFFSGKKNLNTQIGVLNEAVGFIDLYLGQRTKDENNKYQNLLEQYKKTFEAAIAERKNRTK